MATGSTTSGSQATSSMQKPLGTRNVANSSWGERGPACGGLGSAAKPWASKNKAANSARLRQEQLLIHRRSINHALRIDKIGLQLGRSMPASSGKLVLCH